VYFTGKTGMKTYTIGQFAHETGLTARALRIYEAAGLLIPDRGENNYRTYSETQIHVAQVIGDLRSSGVPIATIQELFGLKYSSLPHEEKLSRILSVLDGLVDDLREQRDRIDQALEHLDAERREVHRYIAENKL
jgi:DNA-binding transcriptional MerR regulator